MIDGRPGLRKGVGLVWPEARVERCAVHKLRDLERKAPMHVLAEIHTDFHRIIYAETAAAARTAYTTFARKWAPRCPGVVRSLHEGGEELLTFLAFPKAQWKTLRTTNVIERLHEEFRRRLKTQGSLPTEDAALVLDSSLVGESGCAVSTGGARSRSCSRSGGEVSHDASHAGVRILRHRRMHARA